jgi:hypothetical protein
MGADDLPLVHVGSRDGFARLPANSQPSLRATQGRAQANASATAMSLCSLMVPTSGKL